MLNQRILCISQALTESFMTKSDGKVLSSCFICVYLNSAMLSLLRKYCAVFNCQWYLYEIDDTVQRMPNSLH